jgi:hypothetical protein
MQEGDRSGTFLRRIYPANEAGNVFTVCNTYSRDYYDLLFRYECH